MKKLKVIKQKQKQRQKPKVSLYYFISLFFVLLFNNASSQIVKDYNKFCNSNLLKKNIAYNYKDDIDKKITQKIFYLGNISTKKNSKYKVITSIKNFAGRGVNDLIFISLKGSVFIYRVDLPEYLPFSVSSNKLIFINGSPNSRDSISIDTLNNLFCTPYGCFNRIQDDKYKTTR